MLYKILLSEYFPTYDKIIVSDVDVVFLGDVAKSFLEFSCDDDVYIAGVKANNPDGIFPLNGWKKGYQKFSKAEFEAIQYGVGGGYLIANLKAWRKNNLTSKMISYLQNNASRLVLAEQDVLNIICYPKIGVLSPAHIVGNAMWKLYGEQWEGYKPNFYNQDMLDNARLHPIQLHYIGSKKPWNYPSEPLSDIWYTYLVKTPFLNLHLQNLESVIINNYIKTTLVYRIKALIKRHPLFFIDPRIYFKVICKIIR